MKFLNADEPLTEAMIVRCERECRVNFPQVLRDCYLVSNGGEPDPYVFENDEIDTVVSKMLPLISASASTSLGCYKRLVLGKSIVPIRFFPIAVDGGGDFFFVDLDSNEGLVFFYCSESSAGGILRPTKLGLTCFWDSLKDE